MALIFSSVIVFSFFLVVVLADYRDINFDFFSDVEEYDDSKFAHTSFSKFLFYSFLNGSVLLCLFSK